MRPIKQYFRTHNEYQMGENMDELEGNRDAWQDLFEEAFPHGPHRIITQAEATAMDEWEEEYYINEV